MGLSLLISDACWNRKLAKHWKYAVENLHHSLKFKRYQLLAGVTVGARMKESGWVTVKKQLPQKKPPKTRSWKKPPSHKFTVINGSLIPCSELYSGCSMTKVRMSLKRFEGKAFRHLNKQRGKLFSLWLLRLFLFSCRFLFLHVFIFSSLISLHVGTFSFCSPLKI